MASSPCYATRFGFGCAALVGEAASGRRVAWTVGRVFRDAELRQGGPRGTGRGGSSPTQQTTF